MKITNKIINYYVTQPSVNGLPIVFASPFTINSKVARQLLEKQLSKKKESVPPGDLLHVCFDLDSGRIYVPNAANFTKEKMEYMLTAAKIKIQKDYGNYSSSHPIDGSPYNTIRMRKVSGFGYVFSSIKEHFGDETFEDLPVIEANIQRMPGTLKLLPKIYESRNYLGGYISPSHASVIHFVDEIDNSGRKRDKPMFLTSVKPPFILINISASINPSESQKESVVINGYRDFVYDKAITRKNKNTKQQIDSATEFSYVYAAKRYLYLGWPFEEVCHVLFDAVNDFGGFFKASQALLDAANYLEQEGYSNPASIPYYITFKVNPKTFPIDISSLSSDGKTFMQSRQMPFFHILEYDMESGFILVKTPIFISPEKCMKIFRCINRPLITRYNPVTNKIDVKSTDGTYNEYVTEKDQLGKIYALTEYDVRKMFPENKEKPKFDPSARAREISKSSTRDFHLRKLSEYYYATDHIKKICAEEGLPFKDIDVLVGPIERVFGMGVQGGFMDKKCFDKSKIKYPYEIVKGVWISPPIISINSATKPGYDQQTDTLIHEYTHNIYSITHPDYESEYNKDPNLQKKDEKKYFFLYFTDPNEVKAHINQAVHELISGKTPDALIRDKVGGEITASNYPIALKFKEMIVDEAVKRVEKMEEQNDKPAGKSSDNRGNNQTVTET